GIHLLHWALGDVATPGRILAPLPQRPTSSGLPASAKDLRSAAGRPGRSRTDQLPGGDQGTGGDPLAGGGNVGGGGGLASIGGESCPAAGRSEWAGLHRLRRRPLDPPRAG